MFIFVIGELYIGIAGDDVPANPNVFAFGSGAAGLAMLFRSTRPPHEFCFLTGLVRVFFIMGDGPEVLTGAA